MNHWLMKSEPDVFGIEDLIRVKEEPWDGVRNYQARNMMRDQMALGDRVFFYHSNCETPGVAGLMTVSKLGYPDHTSWDVNSKYYDVKSTADAPRWFMVDVCIERQLSRVITLAELKADPTLQDMPLVKKGNRLSIMPVGAVEFDYILTLESQ